ncbi:hypothetical protein SAMN02799630_03388 [Paenibacillus sp. UNCCL117]|uniref:hypothetical protein n=1 Tax=unclassified Paenibacillus TaxID=185978 RepID=UPI00088D0C99|nr:MULTISPECIES: hypothetical protein [unclassified Paenibacillus]SDE44584.1 hypothetical protein SAMN04488602_12862 [Paenibacillus sp. cl123]SFW46295.1 hypothetical protein SAMN02799630_03388 [Paenibacillus sp. UNCCL117]
MSYDFRTCELEIHFTSYVQFLLSHHSELNLPYSFPQKLSFFSSPLMFGKAMLIIDEDMYEVVGAAGFVLGTGPQQYEDREICQIEAIFIENGHRGTLLFARAMQAFVRLIRSENPDVRQVQFWTAAEPESGLKQLLAKLCSLPGGSRTLVNELAFYTIPFPELENYCARLGPRMDR